MRSFARIALIVVIISASACGLLVEKGREKVAEVEGEPIRLDTLLRRIRELPFAERARTNDQNPAVRLKARRAVLDSIVNEMLLVKEAETRGIQVSDAEIEATLAREEPDTSEAIENIEEGMKSTSSAHEHSHGTEAHSQREIDETRRKLMVEKLVREELSDAAAKDYYEKHIDEFKLPAPVMSFEIVTVNANDGALINQIYEKAKNEQLGLKEAFGTFEHLPPDATAAIIPPISIERLGSGLKRQLRELKVGEISKPFHLRLATTNDYNVVKVLTKEEAAPFQMVKEQIIQKMYRDLLAGLEKKYKVVYYEDKLNYKLGD